MKTDYYYPWSKGRPPFPKSFGNILTNLQRLGFPVFHYQKTGNKPDKRTMKALHFICDTLYEFDADEDVRAGDKNPWIFLLSNSPVLLQALADLVPMTYATTFGASVMKVDNPTLTSAILSYKPKSMWDDDPSGELLAEAKKTNVLYWNFINRAVNRSRFCEGEAGSILDVRSGKPTIFTATYNGKYDGEDTVDIVLANIEKVFGETVSGALDTSAKVVHLAINRKVDDGIEEVAL